MPNIVRVSAAEVLQGKVVKFHPLQVMAFHIGFAGGAEP